VISPAYLQLMARYNIWQNTSLYTAADGLSDAQRKEDRGAFFRSIHGTLNHLLWGDQIWMSRFSNYPPPAALSMAQSVSIHEDWSALRAARKTLDAAIAQWTLSLTEADLMGDLVWQSVSMGRDMHNPRALLMVHMFNHQTHHRGQVHAMLTAAGAKPAATDLGFMPAEFA
jgi:uncharacterized damage-inducible protein DinB